jgi:hypothetical protein
MDLVKPPLMEDVKVHRIGEVFQLPIQDGKIRVMIEDHGFSMAVELKVIHMMT